MDSERKRSRRSDTRRVDYDYWGPLGIKSTNSKDQATVTRVIQQVYAPILNSYLAEGDEKDAKHLFKSQYRFKEFQLGSIARTEQLPRQVRAHVTSN